MKKVTSNDVARIAGVSQSSVSLILSGNNKILFSDATKEKVFAAAKQLNYKAPSKKAALSDGDSKLLLIFVPTMANHYYSELSQAIQQYAGECGYRVLYCNTSRQSDLEKYYLDIASQINAQGLIYTFLPSFPRMVEQFSATVPVVLIGEKQDDLSIPSIELSNVKAGSVLAQHLVDLGHKHIAFLSTPINKFSLAREQRLFGIKEKLKEFPDVDIQVLYSEKKDEADSKYPFEYATGYVLAEKLIHSDKKVTALIGINDMTALGIVQAVRDAGKRIPEDYSVCGFDNIFSSRLSSPMLTTVDHHLLIRGKAAVDMILSKRQQSLSQSGQAIDVQDTAPAVNKIQYEPTLIVRDSTGTANTSH